MQPTETVETPAAVAPRTMGFTEIKTWLRHRHPMLYLDRVLDYAPNERIVASLAVSAQMDAIAGHFPERAIFPASHLSQAFAQAGIILFQLSTSKLRDDELTLVGAMNSRFLKIVVPGDRVEIAVTADRLVDDTFFFSGRATVEGTTVAAFRANLVRRNVEDMGQQWW
ncbi:3-hydroxyacyl-ACP dehydratase FabZ family protein [Kribbella italica]|uniref:3-hydroxyacyl-[acyl-carrier-protein] dehydratase n=1 Tax=Kribbella italica TaxID=1540520 RepID=A0A7W9J510_9ACTN|nr:3-hydroxyacyl-ACP dehydratase FabZ family protein [Kribbella italica]MBB5835643.1 3-hydroxyacyl-[acyl-carrier-protein] dehydratase [Kribbella italica]